MTFSVMGLQLVSAIPEGNNIGLYSVVRSVRVELSEP